MGTLTSAGFTRQTAAQLLAILTADWLAEFGADTDVSSDQPDGVLLRILSQREAEVDEAIEAVYQSIDPTSATGVALDNLARILGLTRNAATKSTIGASGVQLTGTPSTIVPAGTQFSVSATGAVFELDANSTIGGGGVGTGSATATVTGPLAAAIGALTVIDTPVAGLTAVNNTVAATQGTNQETDEELRARMNAEVASTGRGTLDALYTRVADLDGVTSVGAEENVTDATVGALTPHSFRLTVLGGTSSAIGTEIWQTKPAGIASIGTTSVSVTDAAGNTQSVNYTVPSDVTMYVTTVLTVDGDFPDDGTTQVKERILFRLANGLTESEVEDGTVTTGKGVVGDDVLSGLVVRAIYEVPGVVSHTGPFIEDGPSPSATGNFAIAADEVADYDLTNFTVTTS